VTNIPTDGAAETVVEADDPEDALFTCDTPADSALGAGDTVGDSDRALRERVTGAGETVGALVSAATLAAKATATMIKTDSILVNFIIRSFFWLLIR
jgi:hypothetical protein